MPSFAGIKEEGLRGAEAVGGGAGLEDPLGGKVGLRRGAFFDVDGTLVTVNLLHAYLYYAMNARGLVGRLGRLLGFAARLPVYGALELLSRRAFNEALFRAYRGFTEDRLWLMGEEAFDEVIRPAIRPGVRQLLEDSKAQGCELVLVTGSLEHVVAPLARHLGVDAWAANRLEMDGGVATGRVLEPVMAGANKAAWIRRYARRRGLDLEDSFAFADSFSDLPMLVSVGRPCAMNSDGKLRRMASEYRWPVVDSPERR